MIDRLTEVIATCDNESIYGTASALLKIRDELENQVRSKILMHLIILQKQN